MDSNRREISQEQFNKVILDQLHHISSVLEQMDLRVKSVESKNPPNSRHINDQSEDNRNSRHPRGDDASRRFARSEYFDENASELSDDPVRGELRNQSQRQENQPHLAIDPQSSSATERVHRRTVNPRYCNLQSYLVGDLRPSSGPAEELQEEFVSIKDSVSAIRLPPTLKLSDSRQGLRREGQPAYNAVAKSAKYVETTLKILSQLPENDSIVRDLIVIQAAHLLYLAEEQSALLVAGQFNDTTARIYRTLQRHTASFTDSESLDLLLQQRSWLGHRHHTNQDSSEVVSGTTGALAEEEASAVVSVVAVVVVDASTNRVLVLGITNRGITTFQIVDHRNLPPQMQRSRLSSIAC